MAWSCARIRFACFRRLRNIAALVTLPRRRTIAARRLIDLGVPAMTRLFAPPASWVMWLVLSVGTAASSAALASPSTQQSFEGTLASGARWRAEVPDHWNGTLLLF